MLLLRYPSHNPAYTARVAAMYPADQIQHLPIDDLSGTTARDATGLGRTGTYAASGITLAQPGFATGELAASFSGVNTHIKVGSTSFGNAWNGNKGSAIAWGRADNVSRWSDGLVGWWYHIRATDNVDYNLVFGKNGSNLQWRRRSGSANPVTTITKAAPVNTSWQFMGMSWDFSVPEIRGYDATGLVGAASTGMTTWPVGTHIPDSPNLTVYYAGTTTLQEWFGDGAQVVTWVNRVLTAAEFASLAIP